MIVTDQNLNLNSNKLKLYIRYLLSILLAISFMACEKLPLQKTFIFDRNDHPAVKPPFNMSIYEFMNKHAEFSLMVEAIKKAGMEDIYSGGGNDKTILLLRNEAMKEFMINYKYTSVADIPATRLQNLLKYHVITTRFTQNDLPVQDFVVFQTLINDANGAINIYKWREYWEIQINTGGPNLPTTAKKANVYLHNYEFTNGVGHQMSQYVQRIPF